MTLTAPFKQRLQAWIDTAAVEPAAVSDRIQWLRVLPFVLLHVACIAVIWVGVSPIAIGVAAASYVLRMFAVTAFYHRYFSHRAFKTTRALQFVFAVLGASAVQRGPLWWAAHHRHHHAHSDEHTDPHSPARHGFWRAHMGWFLTEKGFTPDLSRVRDLARYPELRWLDRFDIAVPVLFAASLFGLGAFFEREAPHLGTSAWQMLVWGFFISTVVCYHVTYSINSLCHGVGRRRYATGDDSRNNWLLALLTFGEGWHNNHHHYPNSARQGFYWWEIDLTYYALNVLSWFGLVWNLKPVPAGIRAQECVR
ncbi:MAG: acyl-CoA desaturase [Steroidobacteraceae bacterium]